MAAAVAPGASASASGKSGKSAGGICVEDPLLKVAAIGVVLKKLAANALRFVNTDTDGEVVEFNPAELEALGALLGEEFVNELLFFEEDKGNYDGTVQLLEFFGFLNVYYQGVCADELLDMWMEVPVPVVPVVGRRGQGPTR